MEINSNGCFPGSQKKMCFDHLGFVFFQGKVVQSGMGGHLTIRLSPEDSGTKFGGTVP